MSGKLLSRLSLCFYLILTVWLSPALAEKRLALVIGIDDYKEVTKLQKAVGDASAIGDKLAGLEFIVTKSLNPDRRTLNLALANLYKQIEQGDTVLVHYSGHGIEIQGQNYLLPADIPSPENGEVELLKSESLSLQSMVDTLGDKGANVRIVIVDACRDNPFATKGKRSLGGTRGLAAVEPPKGTFIMYSAGTGQSALDRLGDTDTSPTSVYTRVLLSYLDTKGLALRDLAASIREDVDKLSKSVGHEQRPAYYDDLPKDFSFVPGDAAAVPVQQQAIYIPPAAPVPAPAPVKPTLNDESAYKLSETINTASGWEVFLKQYPDSAYTPYAKAARDKLKLAAGPRSIAVVEAQATPDNTPAPKPAKPVKPKVDKPKIATNQCAQSGRVVGLDPNGDNFLSVRTGPGTSFNEITRIYTNDRVSICARSGKWLKVRGAASGWVYGRYVAVGG